MPAFPVQLLSMLTSYLTEAEASSASALSIRRLCDGCAALLAATGSMDSLMQVRWHVAVQALPPGHCCVGARTGQRVRQACTCAQRCAAALPALCSQPRMC